MTHSVRDIPYGSAVPEDWDVVPLKFLATLQNGFVFKSDAWRDTGTPILRIENLNFSTNFNYSDLSLSDRYQVRAGDLLYSWSGNPGTSFGPYRWETPGTYFLNQHIFKVSVQGCDKNWLYWALKAATHWIERELTSGMIGMVHVTKEELSGIPIPLPPIEEQRRIAEFLDAETNRIGRLVELRKRTLALAAEKEQAIRDLAVDEAFESHGSVPLRRLARGITQGASPQCDNVPAEEGEWGVLKLSSVKRGVFKAYENKRLPDNVALDERHAVHPGDLLITRANTPELVGDAAVAGVNSRKVLLPDLIYRLDLLDGVRASFVLQCVLATRIRQMVREVARGSSQSMVKLRGEDILAWPAPRLIGEEQLALVSKIEGMTAHVAGLSSAIDRQLALIAERRQALITAAVTGQFDVTTARGVDVS